MRLVDWDSPTHLFLLHYERLLRLQFCIEGGMATAEAAPLPP
jgi:hypothetical protein